jgi:uncharacterized protein (DUF1697 family)
MNATMPELIRAFEAAGFTDVTTRLSSGNVIFSAPAASESTLERKAEAAMLKQLKHSFLTIIRPVDALRELLASDPYKRFKLPNEAKRVVTFLREKPKSNLALPIERDGTQILFANGREVFSAYVVSPKGAVFMSLIEKSFGKEQTTRTWETIAKAAR